MRCQAHLKNGQFKESVTILKLPYKGENLAMYIYMPNKGHSLDDVMSMLDELESPSELEQSLSTDYVEVWMPKFKVESSYDLKSTLNQVGLVTLFDPSKADLHGLNYNQSDKSLFVSDVVQKAFVEVNEEGTEAAAATGILMKTTAIQVPDKAIHLDRPFLFHIKDTRSGINLFAGRIMNPNQ